jgi:CheY-like chemotaxis protein
MILCVDDEPAGLTARRLLLSTAGYTVLTATSGDAALRLFICNHLDLVITDHLLPDLTGAELVSEMKRLKPEVPVVLFTGLVEPPPGYEQADMLLTKGMTPPEFLAEMAKLLRKAPSTEPEMTQLGSSHTYRQPGADVKDCKVVRDDGFAEETKDDLNEKTKPVLRGFIFGSEV